MQIQTIGVIEDYLSGMNIDLLHKVQIAELVLKKFGSKVWIAGGLAVNVIVDSTINSSSDIDIFCCDTETEMNVFSFLNDIKCDYHKKFCPEQPKSPPSMMSFYADDCGYYESNNAKSFSMGHIIIQVINVNSNTINSLHKVFDGFDIANCQVALTTNGIVATDVALNAIASNLIKLHNIHTKTTTLQRIIKYNEKYKWKLDLEEFLLIKNEWANYGIEFLKQVLTYKALYHFTESDFSGFCKVISNLTFDFKNLKSKVLSIIEESKNDNSNKW